MTDYDDVEEEREAFRDDLRFMTDGYELTARAEEHLEQAERHLQLYKGILEGPYDDDNLYWANIHRKNALKHVTAAEEYGKQIESHHTEALEREDYAE